MDKSYGIRKRKCMSKNKCKKTTGNDLICCRESTNRKIRHYVKSYVNNALNTKNVEALEYFHYPSAPCREYTWSDDIPRQTRVSKLHN
jgi:hypothetical protein